VLTVRDSSLASALATASDGEEDAGPRDDSGRAVGLSLEDGAAATPGGDGLRSVVAASACKRKIDREI
jgi:hypothetical protein